MTSAIRSRALVRGAEWGSLSSASFLGTPTRRPRRATLIWTTILCVELPTLSAKRSRTRCMETLLLTDPLTAVDYGSLDTPLKSTIISIRGGNKSPIGLCTRTTGVDGIGQSETAGNCPTKSNAFDTQLLHLSLRAAHVGTRRSTDERYPTLPATGRSCSLYPRDLGPALLFVMAREARSRRRRPNL